MTGLTALALYLIGFLTGFLILKPSIMRNHREVEEIRAALARERVQINKDRKQVLDLYGAAVAEKQAANRLINAAREFSSLWNYGAKDEAVQALKEAGFPVKTGADNV